MILRLDLERLQQHIESLAAISEASPPVVTRILFSEADLRGRAFITDLIQREGLLIRHDAIGNLFARWSGSDPSLAPIATGSHIDAIPNAGSYDGVVGVLGALEAIRALKQSGFKPSRSIELIVFTAEEPTRFGIGCLGSRLLSGALSAQKAAALRDTQGRTLDQWRRQAGYEGKLDSVLLPESCYAAFIELHIEQGPVLEQEGVGIGVVEKIAAPSTLRVELTGVGGHAGAVLMSERHDALLAGAEIALTVEQSALSTGSADTVATTGVFRIEPGAVNSIPCRVALEIDLRDTQSDSRNKALERIENAIPQICQRRGVEFCLERLNVDEPGICDSGLVETVIEACREAGLPVKTMISRAYHDSLFMARISPTTMIFIPSRDGVSHRPDEYSSPEHIGDGVRVLAWTLQKLAA